MTSERAAEPWMRGTHGELHPVLRAVVHALEQALEDVERWCLPLSAEQLATRPSGLPSVAFHMRHMARSLERLLTYADGKLLDERQLHALETEHDGAVRVTELWCEFRQGIEAGIQYVSLVDPATFALPRGIGRKQLPTTVAGLVIHCAEHTQRHTGQAITTAQLISRSTQS